MVSSVTSFDSALKSIYDPALLAKMRVIVDANCPRGHMYMLQDGSVFAHPSFRAAVQQVAEPLAVGIAATCAIAGLGMLIARRNAVMAEEGPSEPWLKAFIAWACEYVRALFAPQPLALPAHEESDGDS